jgi:transcription initiation factor TFIID subunit 2
LSLVLADGSDGNFNPVRIIAFDCLLLCRPPGRSLAIARYLLDVVRTDSSLGVRRHVAKALSEAILMSLAIGEVFTQPPGVVEGDEAELAERQNLLIVKALRKEFAPRADFKQSLQTSLMCASRLRPR